MPFAITLRFDPEAALMATLPDLPVHAHYRPDHWVPHVTLSGPIPHPDAALAALLPLWRPIEGTLVGLDLVRFRPIDVLAHHNFT